MSHKHRHQGRQGYLGPAFHEYLEYLETVEAFLITGKAKKSRGITVNNKLFDCPTDDVQFQNMIKDMMLVDANLAGPVRSSVKYKITVDTMQEVAANYENELIHIGHTIPFRLPHEITTIIMEGFGLDTMIVVAQEETARDHQTYPELELEEDERFICLNVGAYRPEGVTLEDDSISQANQLSHFPVEIHCQCGKIENQTKVVYAGAADIKPTKAGMLALDLVWRSFVIWHHQFHLQSILRHKQVGVGRVPLSYKPKRLRKKHQHPQFEHTIIEMEIDAPDPSQTGRSIFQPKKRLHQVRGFWRHYRKSGKRVWVKPHWRGDEQLGVIKRDVELVTHHGERQ